MKKCISCNSKNLYSIYNFGNLPLSNEFVKKEKNNKIKKYKLNILVCKNVFSSNENIVKENLILIRNTYIIAHIQNYGLIIQKTIEAFN